MSPLMFALVLRCTALRKNRAVCGCVDDEYAYLLTIELYAELLRLKRLLKSFRNGMGTVCGWYNRLLISFQVHHLLLCPHASQEKTHND